MRLAHIEVASRWHGIPTYFNALCPKQGLVGGYLRSPSPVALVNRRSFPASRIAESAAVIARDVRGGVRNPRIGCLVRLAVTSWRPSFSYPQQPAFVLHQAEARRQVLLQPRRLRCSNCSAA